MARIPSSLHHPHQRARGHLQQHRSRHASDGARQAARALRISRSNLRDELARETEKDIDLELELLELQSPPKLKQVAGDRWGA